LTCAGEASEAGTNHNDVRHGQKYKSEVPFLLSLHVVALCSLDRYSLDTHKMFIRNSFNVRRHQKDNILQS
jgi:hypothetical protein